MEDYTAKALNMNLKKKDIDKTMKTMTKEPYVHHVPIFYDVKGYDEVYNFINIF